MSQKLITAACAVVVSMLAMSLLAGCPPNSYHVLTLTVMPTDGGTIVASPDKTIYFAGTEVTLEAVPNTGYAFRRWVGTGMNTTINPTKKRVYADETVVAEFVRADGPLPFEGEAEDVVVKDGDFEGGAASPYWTEWSLTGSRVICDLSACGMLNGLGAVTGLNWAWFGNDIGTAYETATLSQPVKMPVQDNAYLTFFLAIPKSEMPFSFLVRLGGTVVWEFTDLDFLDYNTGYEMVSLDVSGYADGRNTTLSFFFLGAGTGGAQSAIFLDNISIE